MGREIKRVPMGFDWPLGQTWKGFVNPHYKPCPKAKTNECHGGETNGAQWLNSIARLLALIGEEAENESHAAEIRARGMLYPHPFLVEFPQAPKVSGRKKLLPFTEETAQLVAGLAGGKRLVGPCNVSAKWEIQKNLLKAAGIDKESGWGTCKACDGTGVDPAHFEAYEAWQVEEPPTGEAWQLWETVSDGSPISPAFATPEELIDWMSQPDKSGRRGGEYPELPWAQGYKREHAEAFVRGPGWAPSFVVAGGRFMNGVEASAVFNGSEP